MKIHQFGILLFLILVLVACGDKNNTANTTKPTYNKPIFKALDHNDTGIGFRNSLTENNLLNGLKFQYLYIGGAVAVGDINNDKLPDIYFTSILGDNKLYLNKGDLKFEDISAKAGVTATGGIKTGVAFIDINADGYLDIYQCRSGLEEATRQDLLFINNKDLTFTESATKFGLIETNMTNHVNFLDYDKDGDLDMYQLNHPMDFNMTNNMQVVKDANGKISRQTKQTDLQHSDKLFRNNGNNSFTDVTTEAGITNRAFGLSTAIHDFNDDGYPDIYVANDYIEPDFLYINNKNGTFSDHLYEYFQHTTNNSMGMDIVDINNDGLSDLISLDMLSEDNYRQKTLKSSMQKERYNTLLGYGYGKQQLRNGLQINNGNGKFSDIACLAGISNTDWSWSPVVHDFDNDGARDIFISNGYNRDVTNLDYLNFTLDSVQQVVGFENIKNINDFLKLIPSTKLRNYMFRNNRDLTFSDVSEDWGIKEKTFSNGSVSADLDGDGDLELIISNQDDYASIYENKSNDITDNHYLRVKVEGDGQNPSAIGAKISIKYGNNEQQYEEVTPIRGFFSSNEPISHFGLGSNTSVAMLSVTFPNGKVTNIENVKADQVLTVNVKDATGNAVASSKSASDWTETDVSGLAFTHKENAYDDFDREFLIPHKCSTFGPCMKVADVNKDGLDDVFIGGASGQSAQLFLQQNGGFKSTSSSVFAADKAFEDTGCTFFDADADGDLDLYVCSGGNEQPLGSGAYQDRLYVNDGKGNFAKARNAIPNMDISTKAVSAFDYDGDGDLDLAVGGRVVPGQYPIAPQSMILENNKGIFTDVTSVVASDFQHIGMVTDLVAADMDKDGKPELIVAGEWMPISIFKIQNKKFNNITSTMNLGKSSGWWQSLLVADIDNDGDMDIVAGNDGLNSRWKCSETQPLNIYAKDFDNNGQIDPITAMYVQGQNYPVHLKDNLLKQLPVLKKEYLRYAKYANTTMDKLFKNGELSSALNLSVNTLSSTYFEQTSNGFVAHALPNEAQVSPVNDLILVEQDGKKNILVVGNSNAGDVETGPYDASFSTLLSNDGKGNFVAVPNQKTGIWANKEARHVAQLKWNNNKSLILVANNNDKLQAFVK